MMHLKYLPFLLILFQGSKMTLKKKKGLLNNACKFWFFKNIYAPFKTGILIRLLLITMDETYWVHGTFTVWIKQCSYHEISPPKNWGNYSSQNFNSLYLRNLVAIYHYNFFFFQRDIYVCVGTMFLQAKTCFRS